MSPADQKARLRIELKKRFKHIRAQDSYAAHRQSLLQHLETWLQKQTGIWATYSALETEIDLQPLTENLRHLDFVHPRIVDGKIRFYKVGPRGFEKGTFGIQEPVLEGAQSILPSQISGFLVPGLGFDPSGVRLGKGKGFYDQILEGTAGLKVGVTLQEMLEPQLPEEDRKDLGRDIRMDFIATDKGVMKSKQES